MRILLTGRDPHAFKGRLAAVGNSVEVAKDHADIGELVRSGRFEAIVLDLDAVRNGLSLLKEWRRDGMEEHVFTLSMRRDDTVSALDLGADVAVTKPCPVAELLARFRAMLRLRREFSEPVLRCFDLEINPAARSVKRGGKDIRLTGTEFRLLQFLVFHQGKALSQSMILSFMKNRVSEVRSNIVTVYIRYLRGKIDNGFDFPLIRTVHRKGYMFCGETSPEFERLTYTLDSAMSPGAQKSRHSESRHRSAPLDFHQSAT